MNVLSASLVFAVKGDDCQITEEFCGHSQVEGFRWGGPMQHETKVVSSCQCRLFCCADSMVRYDHIIGWNFQVGDLQERSCQCFGDDSLLLNAVDNSSAFEYVRDPCQNTFDWCSTPARVPDPIMPCANQTQTNLCIPIDLPSEYAVLNVRGSASHCYQESENHVCNGGSDPFGIPCAAAPLVGAPKCNEDPDYQPHLQKQQFGVCIMLEHSTEARSFAAVGNEHGTEFATIYYADKDCKILSPFEPTTFQATIERRNTSTCEMWAQIVEGRGRITPEVSSCAEAQNSSDYWTGCVWTRQQWWEVEIPTPTADQPECTDANAGWWCDDIVKHGQCAESGIHCLKSCGCCSNQSNCNFDDKRSLEEVAVSLGLNIFAAALKLVQPAWRGTVFAPTDEAFKALMGPDPMYCLRMGSYEWYWFDLVRTHTTRLFLTSSTLRDRFSFANEIFRDPNGWWGGLGVSNNGTSITLTPNAQPGTLARTITTADVEASHAMLHVIDGVFFDWVPENCKLTLV